LDARPSVPPENACASVRFLRPWWVPGSTGSWVRGQPGKCPVLEAGKCPVLEA
jgi:hypothetical protein